MAFALACKFCVPGPAGTLADPAALGSGTGKLTAPGLIGLPGLRLCGLFACSSRRGYGGGALSRPSIFSSAKCLLSPPTAPLDPAAAFADGYAGGGMDACDGNFGGDGLGKGSVCEHREMVTHESSYTHTTARESASVAKQDTRTQGK